LNIPIGHSRRRGVSEIVATVVTIAITIIAGAAVFGYVNGAAGVNESKLANSVGGNVQYLEERFSVVQLNYSSSTVTVWLYNMGQVNLSPVQVLVYNNGRSNYLLYNATKIISYKPSSCTTAASTTYENPLMWNPKTGSGLSSAVQTVTKLTLALPVCSGASFSSGSTYTVSVLAVNGNLVVYSQTR
jgi:flagellin-like protein